MLHVHLIIMKGIKDSEKFKGIGRKKCYRHMLVELVSMPRSGLRLELLSAFTDFKVG